LRKLLLLAGLLVIASPSTTGGARVGHKDAVKSGFYFGRVAFEDEVIAVDIRKRHVRVFVTDGQPVGTAQWFEGRIRGERMRLTSASHTWRLRATLEHSHGDWLGTITYPNGKKRNFAVTLAGYGGGIYRITAEADGLVHGRAVDGSRVDARPDGDYLKGVVTEKNGTSRPFRIVDLSRAYKYSFASARPGTYTAIVARRGTLIYGRGGVGSLMRGRPGRNLLAYDVAISARPTPGFFFGGVAFSRSVIGVEVDAPDETGARRIRAFLTNAEPEPTSELQWFSGTVGADDTYRIASATGDARLRGTVRGDFVSGTVVLPDDSIKRFFAVPAGEGAGIYDVTIGQDHRIRGTSEQGGLLEARQEGLFLTGTLVDGTGHRYVVRVGDLTRNLRYSVTGDQPGAYVAVVASRGQLIFGRSGDVRGGGPGAGIIGGEQAG
jgi:hypothetical protein